MKFLHENNRFYYSLLKIKPFSRRVITVTLLGITISFWLIFTRWTIQSEINRCETQLISIAKQISVSKKAKIDCDILSKNIYNIKRFLKPYEYRPKQLNESEHSAWSTLRYARESALTLINYVAQDESDNQLYKKQKISYEFKGEKNRALLFCNKLNSCNKIVDCQKIKIVNDEKNKCIIFCTLEFFSIKL